MQHMIEVAIFVSGEWRWEGRVEIAREGREIGGDEKGMRRGGDGK